MTPRTDLMRRALDRYGFFIRVSDPDENQFGFGASYIDDHTTAAIGTTGTPTARFTVTVLPAGTHARTTSRLPHEHPVDVYLDGAYLATGGWLRDHADIWPDAWLVSVHTPSDLEILVRTAREPSALPTELALARDRPAHS